MGYAVEASGFSDGFVRFRGATALCGSLTKAEAEATAKGYARELMAEKAEGGRVIVRLDGAVIRDLIFRAGKWTPAQEVA